MFNRMNMIYGNTNTTTKNGPKFEVHQSSYTKVQEAQFNSYLKMNKPTFKIFYFKFSIF